MHYPKKNSQLIFFYLPILFLFMNKTQEIAEEVRTNTAAASPIFLLKNQKHIQNPKRASITFIMGEDEKAKNQYYTEAKHFYQYNELEHTDLVVDTCRSLWAIHQVLTNHPQRNGLPWGNINIVVHSNEWTGICMSAFPNGNRMTTNSLNWLIKKGNWKELPTTIADKETTINFQSCGLGRNHSLMLALQQLYFSNHCPENAPVVSASPYFVFYESEKYNGIPLSTRKYKADVWYAFYKTGYREGDIKLSQQLKERYPNAVVNWRQALRETEPNHTSGVFHYNFTIPIEWIVTYETKERLPKLKTSKDQFTWLENQAELKVVLADYGITLDKFRWSFETTNYTFEDGISEPAIVAKGLCTVVCILQKMEANPI